MCYRNKLEWHTAIGIGRGTKERCKLASRKGTAGTQAGAECRDRGRGWFRRAGSIDMRACVLCHRNDAALCICVVRELLPGIGLGDGVPADAGANNSNVKPPMTILGACHTSHHTTTSFHCIIWPVLFG